MSSLPLPVELISKKNVGYINAIRLSNILNEQIGLITIPDYMGNEAIQLQGLDSKYILVLIDSAPLIGRWKDSLDLRRISVKNIKQIEIIKGASSSLYGSNALVEVINVITDNPKKKFEGNGLQNRSVQG